MKTNYTPLVISFLIVIVARCDGTDLEVKGDLDTSLGTKIPSILNQNSSLNEKTGGTDPNFDSKKVDLIKKDKDQVGGSKEDVPNSSLDKSNSSKRVESKEAQNVLTNTKDNDTVKKGEKKEKAGKGSESKAVFQEGKLLPTRKESFRGEECDPSNKCKDEKHALIACLRVPGNESPDLSLLIQNKGKGPLNVTISAPDFVWLEKSQILLQEKEDTKVKVSVRNVGTDNLIVLTAGNGNCSLDFRDLIAQSSRKEAEYASQSTYINLSKRASSIGFIFVAALLVMASIWTCVSFRRRKFVISGSKYQKLEMELPVSGGGKADSDLNDGWDNSWSDGWDDEEAPKTPSMPVTPSLSSQGVSSRRLKKEGWKD